MTEVRGADELRDRNRRLDEELLAEASAAEPDALHVAPEGEWSLAQVLAHLGEFPRFFAAELARWREDPGAVIGRTHEHPARLAAVADPSGGTGVSPDNTGQRDELVAAAREALAVLGHALDTLTDADIEALTQNMKYGPEPLSAFLDRYVIAHKAGHLDQIRALHKAAPGVRGVPGSRAVTLDGFVPWPEEVADRYRREGHWRGETLGQLLRTWAAAYGDRTAVVGEPGATMTYAELDAAADRLAFGLRPLGIGRGDRVVVHLPNVVEFAAISFALWRLGALPVYALPAHREAEIGYFVSHTEAVAYIAPESFAGFDYIMLAKAAREAGPSLRHVLLLGDGGDADLRRLLAATVDPDEARAAADAEPPAASDVALFLLSGGTTGLPKLIARTHDDYAYNFRASTELCRLGPDTVYLVALPAAHNFPLACPGMLGTLSVGGRVVMSSRAKPEDTFRVIEAQGVTITALVPTLAIRWLEAPERARFDLSTLQVLQVGGARLNPEVARRVGPELGCTLQQVFGMGEGLLNYTRLDDPDEVVITTQGRPMSPADEVLVVDADGKPAAPGEPGELLTRGPYTIRGYYRAEEHNARAFTPDGFYRTGDVVRADAAGNLTVEGRMKDLINRGGEKISAEEIENLLLGHASVSNTAAVAMPDPVMGEKVCAYVVLRPGAEPLTLDGLREYLAGRGIARFKWPERIETVDALPLTKVGKVDKKALREDIAGKLEMEGTGAAP